MSNDLPFEPTNEEQCSLLLREVYYEHGWGLVVAHDVKQGVVTIIDSGNAADRYKGSADWVVLRECPVPLNG